MKVFAKNWRFHGAPRSLYKQVMQITRDLNSYTLATRVLLLLRGVTWRAPDLGEYLIAKVRSAYLRDEARYDRWGGLGKVLVTLEVFRREGVEMEVKKLGTYINAAFPRTFSCQRTPGAGETLPSREEIRAEHASMVELFGAWGVTEEKVGSLALDEIGERRCLDPRFLREYLK